MASGVSRSGDILRIAALSAEVEAGAKGAEEMLGHCLFSVLGCSYPIRLSQAHQEVSCPAGWHEACS